MNGVSGRGGAAAVVGWCCGVDRPELGLGGGSGGRDILL